MRFLFVRMFSAVYIFTGGSLFKILYLDRAVWEGIDSEHKVGKYLSQSIDKIKKHISRKLILSLGNQN